MSSEPPKDSAEAPRAPRATLRWLAEDAALWTGIVCILLVFRAVLLLLFRSEMDPASGGTAISRCFAVGARFDARWATAAVLPRALVAIAASFVAFGPWHQRLRSVYGVVLAVVGALTFIVDAEFFREYHDQFNHWIFGLVFDDRGAIAATVWKSYPVVWLTLLAAVLVVAFVAAGRLLRRAIGRRFPANAALPSTAVRCTIAAVTVVAAFFGLRASFESRPLQAKDAAVTGDDFLDKLVMNPFAAFWNAVDEYRVSTQARGLELILKDGDVRAAAKAWFGTPVRDLDEATRRRAAGSPAKKPRHVVVVVLESYDSWGMRPENAGLRATERLTALASTGIAADAFVSAGDGTMPSLAALITGIPEAGVKVNYQAGMRGGVPTGAPGIFKRLGYTPRFFYGGYPSWQRLGEFCSEQGFAEVHGGGDMSERLTGNEWGVDDADLYAYVLGKLGDEPSFDVLMTTSYHPPYSVDLDAEGFRTGAIAAELASRGLSDEETRILGHLWYSDRALGDFVDAVEKKHPDALVAITGDHWSRRAFSSRPILFSKRAVPFVLHGPGVLAGVPRPPKIAGGHVDVLPTLIELCAPAGFEYHAFGRNLLDATQPQVGYGNWTALTPDVIVDVQGRGRAEDMSGRQVELTPEIDALRTNYRRLHALAWWRVMKGKDL